MTSTLVRAGVLERHETALEISWPLLPQTLTLARAPEQVAHAGGGTVQDTAFIAPTCVRSLQAAGAGGRHTNDTETYTPQVPSVHNVYNQNYVGTVGIDPVAASHAAVNVGLAIQSVAAQAAETTRAEVQREAAKTP